MKAEDTRLKSWIKLLSTPEIGNTRAVRLIKLIGEPIEFLEQDRSLLDQADFLTSVSKNYLKNESDEDNWLKISDIIQKYDIKYTSILDENFPERLKSIYDPPPLIFYRGKLNNDLLLNSISIVGTRNPSNYGKLITRKLASQLAEIGFTIVSGMAFGIDTLAHYGALDAGGKTISVLGTGVDYIYPAQNRDLAAKIIQNGALISEYIPGSKPEKWNFPARNRLISGVAIGTIVIEGSKRSGALLTAKFALDQNRDVFALPGDINRIQAEGPNQLIKQGAKIITSVRDILEEYNLSLDKKNKPPLELSSEEEQVYKIIKQNKPFIEFDSLLIKSNLHIGKLSTILLSLELNNIIQKLPGNKISTV